VSNDGASYGDVPVVVRNVEDGFECHVGDPVKYPEIWYGIKIYNRSVSASGVCQWWEGWRGRQGFIGHDGIPWLWEASKECWLPVTESSHAAAYAILKNGAPPA
jgi:hypothetical protein